MGYRSEVILAVGPEVMPQFMVTMAKSPEARKLCWGDTDNLIEDYGGDKGAFLFRWADIKWYDSYEDVKSFNAIVESNEDNFCVAMGEDYAIHSDIGEWYDYIELEVKLNIL